VKVKRTLPTVGFYESIEVGKDLVTAVTEKYGTPFSYTGKINNVTIDLK
jgi:hypothetical protein